MPPRKNSAKTKEVIDSSEPVLAKQKPEKAAKNVAKAEASSRTLRPRKVPPQTEPVPTKTQRGAKSKETNGVASTKKGTSKGKRAKVDADPEEPISKIIKNEDEVEEEDKNDDDEHTSASSIYDFKANTIQGKEISLSQYEGHVCIIVNVASKCGHTASNYKEFVELYDKYSDKKGLRILAFPCNQFSKQEPGDNEKICEFAKKKNVKFDMFEKIDVNGKNAHPLWKYLTSQKEGPKGAKIEWNFTKFLIDENGQVVDRFKSAVKPLALVEELEKLW